MVNRLTYSEEDILNFDRHTDIIEKTKPFTHRHVDGVVVGLSAGNVRCQIHQVLLHWRCTNEKISYYSQKKDIPNKV